MRRSRAMPVPMSALGSKHATSNGSASELARGRSLLADGLEDPWGVHAPGKDGQRRPGTARRQAAQTDDWGPDPHAFGRRSRSLTLDEVQSTFSAAGRAQLASQPPAAEGGSSRSWMKPFGRKKKAARPQDDGSSLESSVSTSGRLDARTTFTAAQLQRAVSAGLPSIARQAAANGAAADVGATAGSDAVERAPSSSGRRLWSRSSEHVAGREAKQSGLSKTDRGEPPATEMLERSKSSTEGSGATGSRWNLFSRGTAKSAATTPTEPVLLTSGVDLRI